MELKGNALTYEWEDGWAGLNGPEGWSHHDLAIDGRGRIFASFNTEPFLRVFDADGRRLGGCDLSGPAMHCLYISREDGREWLWNVDLKGQVLTKSTLDGEPVASIGREAFGVTEGERLCFTSVAVDSETGNVWVADGYGHAMEGRSGGNHIHCFGPDLRLLFRFDGGESPCGPLREPHWIHADRRKGRTEMYVADRGNDRIVVFDGEGRHLRTIEGGFVTPSAFAGFGDKLVVAELKGRVHILDADDRILDTFADGSALTERPGWPNVRTPDGPVSPVPELEPGRFNSPHGIAADADGNVYVHEWLAGVRLTRLRRVP